VADPLAASYLVGGTLEEYVQLLSLFTLVLMSCKRNPHISFNHQHIISRLAHSFNDADVMSLTSSSTPLTISQHTSHFLSPISNHGPHIVPPRSQTSSKPPLPRPGVRQQPVSRIISNPFASLFGGPKPTPQSPSPP